VAAESAGTRGYGLDPAQSISAVATVRSARCADRRAGHAPGRAGCRIAVDPGIPRARGVLIVQPASEASDDLLDDADGGRPQRALARLLEIG
jgi:hypothetical protein